MKDTILKKQQKKKAHKNIALQIKNKLSSYSAMLTSITVSWAESLQDNLNIKHSCATTAPDFRNKRLSSTPKATMQRQQRLKETKNGSWLRLIYVSGQCARQDRLLVNAVAWATFTRTLWKNRVWRQRAGPAGRCSKLQDLTCTSCQRSGLIAATWN